MDGAEVKNLPVPSGGLLPAAVPGESALPAMERYYLMIALFVRIQHLRFSEALTLILAMIAAGEIPPDLLFAKAVFENAMQDHESALATVRQLEKLDPAVINAGSKATKRARMRVYIKARAALDFYIRHGRKRKKAPLA